MQHRRGLSEKYAKFRVERVLFGERVKRQRYRVVISRFTGSVNLLKAVSNANEIESEREKVAFGKSRAQVGPEEACAWKKGAKTDKPVFLH